MELKALQRDPQALKRRAVRMRLRSAISTPPIEFPISSAVDAAPRASLAFVWPGCSAATD